MLNMSRKRNDSIGRFAGSLEALWFRDNYDEIKKIYWGKWICIKGKKIVDADSDFNKLEQRIGRYNFVKVMTFHVIYESVWIQPNSWGFVTYD